MTITTANPMVSEESNLFDRIPQVKRTQQILLFLISIVFSICVISFITVIYCLSIKYRTNTYEPILILIWMTFFSSGMLVTQRYYPTGLLIFAWLGIVNIIFTCIIVVFATIGIVIITSRSSRHAKTALITVSPIVACLTSVILDALIVIYSFKLWYLITKYLNSHRHSRV